MMYIKIKMGLKFKQILLFLLFVVVLSGNVMGESEKESSQRLRAPTLRNTGSSVIDGTGTTDTYTSDNTRNGLGERMGGNSKVSVSTVAFFTLAMAAATGLGALPFFFVELDPQWAGICNGMAAGVMLAASFDLIQEGQDHGSGNWVVIGILTGGIFIWLCKKVTTLVSHVDWGCNVIIVISVAPLIIFPTIIIVVIVAIVFTAIFIIAMPFTSTTSKVSG